MPRFRKIYINSSHRKNGTSTRFHYELPLDQECTEETHCAVTSVSLPNVFFGINASNNKFYIYEKHPSTESLSQNRVLTLAPGNYSATTVNATLSNLLNTGALGSASYTCNYNSVTQRITITQSAGGGFTVFDAHTLKTLGRKDPATGGFYGSLPTIASPQSIQQILNIPPAADPNVVFESGIISTLRVSEVYLRSPNLTNMSSLDANGRMDVLKRIPLTTNFGEITVTDSNIETSDLMNCSGKTLRALDFMLTDSHAEILDLQNMDFSFCLNFVYGTLGE